MDSYMYRKRGYAPKGQKVAGRVCGKKYARKSIVAGKKGKELLSPFMYDGTMNSGFFEQWVEYHLIPATDENDVFIMDNAAFHRKKQLREICARHGRRLVFLPPYSPELNPIEKTWAWLKKLVTDILPGHGTIEDAICSVFNSI